EISIKRDGLTLKGDVLRPEGGGKCPAVIIFHGLMSDRGNPRRNMFVDIADAAVGKGMAVFKFDFDGHGESDGSFSDMNVFSEILDAAKIIDYVRGLDWVSEINIVGHSQGAVVGGMIAGYYREYVSRLVMLAPAATLKDDALKGSCFSIEYDSYNVPEHITMKNDNNETFEIGNLYFRIAKTLPIYETTSLFKGKTLIIHGSEDDAVGVIGSKRYAEAMDNVRLEIIEGENHGLCKFSLDNVVKEVAEFLSE
ncbi:MAG: alpha/beta fold hydrolase, partial [Oscillospiraceae bacterium]|nr:alpha/beta fold hydrolase [Oscillospiraceae bacterium]